MRLAAQGRRPGLIPAKLEILFMGGRSGFRRRFHLAAAFFDRGVFMNEYTNEKHEKVNRKKIANYTVSGIQSKSQKKYGTP
jgi:hypothetical protein